MQCRKDVVAGIWYNFGDFDMCMMDEIVAKRDEIYAIARKHKAEKLWVFGSCARREERPDSDVDFLVKFSPDVSFSDYDSMEQGISALLGRGVDLINATALERSPFFAYNARKDMVAV